MKSNAKDGERYIDDLRFYESRWLFDSSKGTMGVWLEQQGLREQEAELIAEYVFGAERCRSHWHDSLGNDTSVTALVSLDNAFSTLRSLVEYNPDIQLQTEFVEVPKGDPLRAEQEYSYSRVTLNGYVGLSLHDMDNALWMALLAWAKAEKEKKDGTETSHNPS